MHLPQRRRTSPALRLVVVLDRFPRGFGSSLGRAGCNERGLLHRFPVRLRVVTGSSWRAGGVDLAGQAAASRAQRRLPLPQSQSRSAAPPRARAWRWPLPRPTSLSVASLQHPKILSEGDFPSCSSGPAAGSKCGRRRSIALAPEKLKARSWTSMFLLLHSWFYSPADERASEDVVGGVLCSSWFNMAMVVSCRLPLFLARFGILLSCRYFRLFFLRKERHIELSM